MGVWNSLKRLRVDPIDMVVIIVGLALVIMMLLGVLAGRHRPADLEINDEPMARDEIIYWF